MIRVISSPSISTTGFTTLIFAIRGILRSGLRERADPYDAACAGASTGSARGPGEPEQERSDRKARRLPRRTKRKIVRPPIIDNQESLMTQAGAHDII